jgi:hypothetical protein
MAVQNRAALKSDKDTAFADNSAGDISAADLRGEFEDVLDSVYIPGDDNTGDTQLMTAAEKSKLAGVATGATANPNAIDNVVEDTTPQLGGNLDVNGNSIVSASNGNITIAPNGTGNVVLGNFTLDADATVGAGQDNYVLTYDHGTGTWGAEAAPGSSGGDAWSDPVDANIVPDADGTRDLGSATNRFANVHVDSIDLNGTTLSGSALSDPGADSFLMWDDSATATAFFSLGTGLSATGTTVNAEVSLANTATLTNKTLTAPVINPGVTTDATTARTLALTDASDVVLMSSGSANTVTIPTNASVAFATGTMITVVSTGAGTTTIAGDTGVTLQGNGGSVSAGSCDIQTQYGAAALIKVASDTWVVSGDIDTVA